ncbi:amidohydrolase family protein [Mesorhizobium sp. 10J20-29]
MEVWNKYGPTAAREHSGEKSDRRYSAPITDMHAHVAIPAAGAFVGSRSDFRSTPLGMYSSEQTVAINKQQEGDVRAQITGYDERFAVMESMGVERQLVMCPPFQTYYETEGEVGMRASEMINQGLFDFVSKHSDRLFALGNVPLQAPDIAVKQLEDCMKAGFKGVQILTNVNGIELSDTRFETFWKRAEDLGAIVLLHPNGFTEGRRFASYYFNNIIGNPLETTIALHHLIFAGVLERYPELKILSVHGGGYLAAYSGRIDHAWGARSDARTNLPRPPTHYLRKVFVDTVVFTPHQLRALVEVFGAEHVVLGTDFPFDMAEFKPVAHVEQAGLSDDVVDAIVAGNARRLLGV